MPQDNPRDKKSVYTYAGNSPVEEYLEVASIYNKEAKQLFDRAQQALAEDRQEEARLLTDIAISRREKAEEFEKAAKEKGDDPIVTEILSYQQELRDNYIPHTPTYTAPEDDLPPDWLKEYKRPPLGRFARLVAWFGSWIS
jgi:hypothetical protein